MSTPIAPTTVDRDPNILPPSSGIAGPAPLGLAEGQRVGGGGVPRPVRHLRAAGHRGPGPEQQPTHAGGYVGLITAVAAWYASFAGVLNATWNKTVLPLIPLS